MNDTYTIFVAKNALKEVVARRSVFYLSLSERPDDWNGTGRQEKQKNIYKQKTRGGRAPKPPRVVRVEVQKGNLDES